MNEIITQKHLNMGGFEGNRGSLTCFFEGKMIAQVPLTDKKTVETYRADANFIILDGMKKNKMNIRGIKTAFWRCIHLMKDKDDLDLQDSLFVAQAMLGLIKMQQIDEYSDTEGLLIMPLAKWRRRPPAEL